MSPDADRSVRRPIPSVTQYASPELIGSIVYGGRPRTADPRWRETGAPDLDAYGAWCARWCGMACLRMVLLARDGTAPSLYELATGGARYGAYVDEPGRPAGLVYAPFVEYARREHGVSADVVTDLGVDRLTAELTAGRLVIASVSPEIRCPEGDPPSVGGHLVLVTGLDDGRITFHDPAGHTPSAVVATLPPATFGRFAAGRGIALDIAGPDRSTPVE